MTPDNSIPKSRSITPQQEFAYTFSIATLVTDMDEYREMTASAVAAGFTEDCCEYLHIDNSSGNTLDGFRGLDRMMQEATGEYLIICHQDVLFNFDRRADLENRIHEIEQLDRQWAVLGNAGCSANCHNSIRISDPHHTDLRYGAFPQQVGSLDENFIVINRRINLATSAPLSGFHLYGTDLCQNAHNLGYRCYTIDFHLFHKSPGDVNQSFREIEDSLFDLIRNRKRAQLIQTMCTRFYVSDHDFRNRLFKWKPLLNLLKSLNRRFSAPPRLENQ